MHGEIVISGKDLLDTYAFDPIQIAEWVEKQQLEIIGIDDPNLRLRMITTAELDPEVKQNIIRSKIIKFSELNPEVKQKIVKKIIDPLKMLLLSRQSLIKRNMEYIECLDQMKAIEHDIEDVIRHCAFDHDQFYLIASNSQLPSAEKDPSTVEKPIQQSGEEEKDPSIPEKSNRPSVTHMEAYQKKARELWAKEDRKWQYATLARHLLKKREAYQLPTKRNGKDYSDAQVAKWISDALSPNKKVISPALRRD